MAFFSYRINFPSIKGLKAMLLKDEWIKLANDNVSMVIDYLRTDYVDNIDLTTDEAVKNFIETHEGNMPMYVLFVAVQSFMKKHAAIMTNPCCVLCVDKSTQELFIELFFSINRTRDFDHNNLLVESKHKGRKGDYITDLGVKNFLLFSVQKCFPGVDPEDFIIYTKHTTPETENYKLRLSYLSRCGTNYYFYTYVYDENTTVLCRSSYSHSYAVTPKSAADGKAKFNQWVNDHSDEPLMFAPLFCLWKDANEDLLNAWMKPKSSSSTSHSPPEAKSETYDEAFPTLPVAAAVVSFVLGGEIDDQQSSCWAGTPVAGSRASVWFANAK